MAEQKHRLASSKDIQSRERGLGLLKGSTQVQSWEYLQWVGIDSK